MIGLRAMNRTVSRAALAALALATPALAQPAYQPGKPYLLVETGQRFQRLQDAIYAVGDGAGTIRIAPGHYQDCGVQEHGRITYAAEIPGQTIFERTVCEDKAGLVLRGAGARVVGLVFARYHVADGNGAGIRLEHGNLAVSQAWFRDSEEGILAADDPAGSISIDSSTFTHLGRCDRGLACAHSAYLNFYGHVKVTHSRFEKGDGGHYLKVRAGHVEIIDNSFDDAEGRQTNYLIDLPAGATGRISGNWFIQGAHKENPRTLIAVAAETRKHSSDGLRIENNVARFAPGATRSTTFVADWSGDHLLIGSNQLAEGIGRYEHR